MNEEIITYTNKMPLKEDINYSHIPFSGANNLKSEEITEFVDKLVKESCTLKKEIILKEIEIEKLKEMLKNSNIKYLNLETGNINNTDRIYFDKIRNINLENDYKLNQINLKYENELQKIIEEHNKVINEIQDNKNDNINNININNLNNNSKNNKNQKINLDDNKTEEYLLRIKTL